MKYCTLPQAFMITNDEKLRKFHTAINQYAEEQRRKIEDEVESFKQHELESAETEVLTEAYRLIQDEMAQMRDSIAREMAKREMNSRRVMLERRRDIMEEIFSRAADSLRTVAGGPEYPALLERFAKNLAPVFPSNEVTLCMRSVDARFEPLVAAAFGKPCSFETDDGITLGGIRAYCPETGLEADETLDSLLDDQRDWFEENSGMAILPDKEGDGGSV